MIGAMPSSQGMSKRCSLMIIFMWIAISTFFCINLHQASLFVLNCRNFRLRNISEVRAL